MDRVLDAVKLVITEYKKVALVLLLLVFLFPFITTVILWMDRTGYFTNVYQTEHAKIQQLITDTNTLALITLKQLKINHLLISNASYYQQRTCVNTAKTPEAAQLCLRALILEQTNENNVGD